MEEIFSLNNNLLINNDVSLNGNLNVKNINTIDLSVNNILKTKHLDIYGNLTVHGTQTIINSEVLNVDDNIIIVNADGEFIQQAGLQANIDGNLYGLLYDTSITAWTINNKNLHLNKLVGNNIELTENVNAFWFNGNLTGTNATLTENVRASWFNGNLSGTNATLTENVRASWFNGNLSGTNASLSNNVNASWFNGNLYGTNATLTENVRASWFNGNLSGTNATLTENVRASWFNGNFSGTNATLTENVRASWFNGNLSGINATLTENVNAQWFNGNLSGINATLTENVNAQWFNGNLSGINAILTENITAQWFNGNLSGTNATLTENVNASWFNGNLSGTNATLTETLTANTIHVNELHLGPNTLYIDNEPILYSHNGNLIMSIDHFHGDLTGNLISKNTFLNGNIIIGNNFGIKFHDGTSITSGNITSTSGGGGTSNVTPQEIDDRISNYLFNRPDAPTDSSHNFQIITSNNGTHPTITLKWSNPTTKRVAFSFGTTPGYNRQVSGNFISDFNLNKNITHLPYSKELIIQYREENGNLWDNLTLHSDGTSSTQYIIPDTVITANLNNSNNAPILIANTESNTYTEFKSGNILIIGKSYQFRIYLTNEITEEDGSYNYLYIPSETEYIPFGGFVNVTSPTEILFPKNIYYTLEIAGINGNTYVETGMHTTFPIPENYDLRVRYGFDIDIRANVNSKQMPHKRANTNSGKFITDYLTDNTFTENITSSSRLQLTNSNTISWYPEFDYNVSKFFMEANLDIVGNIARTTIGNTITTLPPSRTDISAATIFFDGLTTQDYTSYFSNNDFGIIKSNIYRYGNDTSIDNIYILDSTQSFDLSFNPNIKIINNRDEFIGIDSSGNYLSQFKGHVTISLNFNPPRLYNSITNKTKGFLQVTDISVNTIFNINPSFDSSGLIINGYVLDGADSNNLVSEGYYTDIYLNELGVKNINLTDYPDICNNSYNKYRVIIENYSFDSSDTIIIPNTDMYKGNIYFDFGVAEKSASDIQGMHNLTTPEVSLDNNFFGLKRPNTSTQIDINYTLSLSYINQFWRSNLNIINNLDLTYNHNSIPLDSINSSDKLWASNANININPNLSIDPANLWYNTSNNTLLYSRNFTETHQLKIDYNINNNIGRNSATRISYIEFGFGTQGKILWWDYTWGINNGPPSNFFSTTPIDASSTIQFINTVGNNTFSSNTTFDHETNLADNQLMWANGGFRSGGITQSDNNNPYIDYTNFYNPFSVLRNYESIRTLGDTINYNYTPGGGRQWWNNTTLNETLSTLVKFITFNIEMPYKEDINGIGNRFIFTITINSLFHISSPTNIDGFLIFHTEKNTSNITSGPYDGQAVFAIENSIGSHNGDTSNPGYVIRNTSSDIPPGPKTTLQISIGIPNNLNINMQQVSIGFQKIE